MVSVAKPSVSIVRVYGLPPQLRTETKQQADILRVAAFEAREDIRRLGTFPDEISPAEFRELKQRIALLLGASADCLENVAVMLDTLVVMNIPAPEPRWPLPEKGGS